MNKIKYTAVELMRKLNDEVEEAKPSRQKMLEDIKMMNFKIRSLTGDVSLLVKENVGFITALWKIGKIEEIVNNEAQKLDEKEKNIFFYSLHTKQEKMRKTSAEELPVVEVEILKNRTEKMIN